MSEIANIKQNEHTIRYEIQVYRDGTCCEDHTTPGWYPAEFYRGILSDPNTSQDYAETLLARVSEMHYKARYRLVEIEEHHKIVERVLA